ncbi:MAG: gamma-glutamyl-gamma-aminobutyrate hydrolase family protein [Thermoleophilia bacterium]
MGSASELVHGKADDVTRIAPDPLLDMLDERFSAGRYHSLAAHEPIPAELVVTARADDGTVMAVRHTSQPTHGLQFHPESVLTPQGPEMMAAFLGLAATA